MNCSSMNWRTSIKAGLGPSPALHPSLLRGPLYILREYRGLAYLYFFLLIIPDLFICSLPSPTTYVFYSFGFMRFDPCTVAICRAVGGLSRLHMPILSILFFARDEERFVPDDI